MKSKLCVQTVPQTTYLETIVADMPTICFWNPDANHVRHDLKKYYDEMYEAGVFHLSPESAAMKVNEIADAPRDWWRSTEVRQAVDRFRQHVCMTDSDCFATWSRALKDIPSATIRDEAACLKG